MEILSVENLTFTYNGAENPTLKDVSFKINSGEICLVMGKSGCGKTTLLRLLKKEISPCGNRTGEINVFNSKISELSAEKSACKIGFVMQNPDEQTVTDNVFSEMCFGLENMGIDTDEINRRVGETVNYFGIESLLNRQISTLSGGQKQLCSLCAIMAMNPEILILDEPTATLDPVSSENFVRTLLRCNRELGTTIIIAEHNSEDIFSYADTVLMMENGEILSDFSPEKTALYWGNNEGISHFLPCSAQIFSSVKSSDIACKIPLTIRDGRVFLENEFRKDETVSESYSFGTDVILSCKDISFRYEKDLSDIVSDMDFSLYKGEFFSVVGSNGSGKTTLIKVLGGLLRCFKGSVKIEGKRISSYKNGLLYKNLVAVLPQNPYNLFVKETVREDFEYVLKAISCDDNEIISEISKQLSISHLLACSPFDLSGGEAGRCALARILLCKPRIIFLDEPVKALDSDSAKEVGDMLKTLQKRGITVFCVTHNLEFAAEYSDRCGMFFDGKICAVDTPQRFFGTNNFYTTAAYRISRNVFTNCVTLSELNDRMKGQVE